MPKSRLQVVTPDDLAELGKISAARPSGREVVETARQLPKARVREYANGQFDVSTADSRTARELSSLFSDARRLESERGEKNISRRETVEVVNFQGRRVQISPDSERGAARAGLIHSSSRMVSAGRAPRCWSQGHDYRNGRCWWCGRRNGADA